MTAKKYHFILTVFLVIVLSANLLNVQVAFAEGETPTEPPAATEVVTEPTTEPSPASTAEPVDANPVPGSTVEEDLRAEVLPDSTPSQDIDAAEITPVTGILSEVPEDTSILVLDEEGDPVALGSQATADAVLRSDPVWCPASLSIPTPGANGCSISYGSFGELVFAMRTTPENFDEAGTIFLEKPSGPGFTTSLALTNAPTSLAGSYATLSAFDLTIQGGWDGSGTTTVSGQTNFGVSGGNQGYILIGSTANPWAGNITLNDVAFTGISSSSAVRVYADRNITLDNVDVTNQGGGTNTALLNSTSGNIVVQNGSTFDGNNSNNYGLSATTGTGTITISDTSFTDVRRPGTSTYNGATLSASIVTLRNVLATNNDGSGINITNADLVTLSNVTASNNGFSGVYVDGNLGSRLIVNSGAFNNNQRYGIQVAVPANMAVYAQTMPVCTGNGSACSNDTILVDNTPPVIAFVSRTAPNGNGWNNTNVTVNWSCADSGSGPLSNNVSVAITTEGVNQSVTGICTDKAGNTASATQTGINIDKTAPVMALVPDITVEATSSTGASVNYTVDVTDNLDGSPAANCSPASGSTFGMGTTAVNCAPIDKAGNTTSGDFSVTVGDTTPPTITPHANMNIHARGKTGAHVVYDAVMTWDAVDGVGTAACSPASGSFLPLGNTLVTCVATDSSGNLATGKFLVSVDREGDSQVIRSGGSSGSATLVDMPVTDLDCESVFWAFGIKLSFMNLCDQQTMLHGVAANALPAELPDGFSFVMGLDVDILTDGEIVETLPEGTGILLDFPTGSDDEFAVLHWDQEQAEWIEASLELDPAQVSQAVANGDEFYHLVNENIIGHFCQALTTVKTGIFVLVKK